jgi:F-type H+-transporting ATPase subunit alpha
MQLKPSEISDLIRQRLQSYQATAEARTEGTIVSLADGIARIYGLDNAMQGEMIEFPAPREGDPVTYGWP